MNAINYEKLYRLGLCKAENYKQELTIKKKIASTEISKLDKTIKVKRKKLKELVKKYQNDIDQYVTCKKEYKELTEQVNSEYSYRKKISYLLKKHNYLDVEFLGDGDVYTTWVYNRNFSEWEKRPIENDIYYDSHFCDSYSEAYSRCLDYIQEQENYLKRSN
jgi:DNA repair exonuclease SbcCD ATPase subunit